VRETKLPYKETAPGYADPEERARSASDRRQALLFTLDEQRYALPLSTVERVVHMVAITPLPQAPAIVLGVINVHGRLMPALDLRRRFRLPLRDVSLTDRLIIAHAADRVVALAADAVSGVLGYCARDAVAAHDIVPGVAYTEGVLRLADGLVLIHDLGGFLSLDEQAALDRTLAGS